MGRRRKEKQQRLMETGKRYRVRNTLEQPESERREYMHEHMLEQDRLPPFVHA